MWPMIVLFAFADCAARGVVQESSGRPVPGAAVVAVRADGFTLTGVMADEQGAYCLPKVPPGAVRLTATARRRPASARPGCPDAECCDPRATEYAPASAPVGAGRLTLAETPAFCVRGELTNPRAGVSIARDGWSSSVMVENGRFLLTALRAGDYLLTVRNPDTDQMVRQQVRVAARPKPALLRIPVPW